MYLLLYIVIRTNIRERARARAPLSLPRTHSQQTAAVYIYIYCVQTPKSSSAWPRRNGFDRDTAPGVYSGARFQGLPVCDLLRRRRMTVYAARHPWRIFVQSFLTSFPTAYPVTPIPTPPPTYRANRLQTPRSPAARVLFYLFFFFWTTHFDCWPPKYSFLSFFFFFFSFRLHYNIILTLFAV